MPPADPPAHHDRVRSLRQSPLRLAVALVLLVAIGLLLWRWQRPAPVQGEDGRTAAAAARAPRAAAGPASGAQPPVPVVLAEVGQRRDDLQLTAFGSGRALASVTLVAEAPGLVVERRFGAGQRVAAGQVLVRLDDRQQRLAVDEAAARLDAARQLLARYEATRGTGAVPGSVIDEAASQARLAEIALRQAREALADRVLRAPFAGVLGLPGLQAGDRVTADTPIATLDDRRRLLVDFELAESHAARLRLGHPVQAATPAHPGRLFEGRITEIDSRIDPDTRNLRLRAELPNAADLLRPGMSFDVQVTLGGEAHLAVPELALQWGRNGAFVWAVRDGRAAEVPVRPVRRVDGLVLVAAAGEVALRPGDAVVVEGVQRLRAGRAVRAEAAASAPRAAAGAASGAGATGASRPAAARPGAPR
jgi:RND family efflux transporter MFP subunit